MAARKKPLRPLVAILADLMKEVNDASFELPEDTSLIQHIRAFLVDKGVMLFMDVRDHQILDGQDGSSWAAVDIQITAVEALSGDEVKMSYIGQAEDEASRAYDRAFDQALTQCLLKTLVYVETPAPEPEVLSTPEVEVVEEATEPQVVEDVRPEEKHEEPAPDVAETHEEPAHEPEAALEEQQEEAPEEAPEPEEVPEEVEERDDIEPEAQVASEPEVPMASDVEPEPESEPEVVAEPEENVEEPPVQAQEHVLLGFSGHPLWQEFWEVLSGEVEAYDHEHEAFVQRLTSARGVEHLHWLSPEQLQAEVDFLDNADEPGGYFQDPSRELQSNSERFMQALQRVTDGAQAKAFRDLYLARMGASLLTDVEENKLSRMIEKLTKFNHDERAGYVADVLRTEA